MRKIVIVREVNVADKKQKAKKALQYGSAKERAERHESGFEPTAVKLPEGVSRLVFKKEGTYRLDVLPYITGKGNPFVDEGVMYNERTYWVHRGIGAESNSYCCLSKTFKKKCPICEHIAKLKRQGGDDDTIKALKPSERQLFNVKDLGESDKGIQVLDQSHFLFGKLIDEKVLAADPEDNYENYFHLEGGMTLKIRVVQDSFGGNTFYKATNIEMKPRKDYDEGILEEVTCLDECLVQLTYDELKSIFEQTGGDSEESDDDSDDDDLPPAKAKGKPQVRKPADDDEDEDEEDEDPSDLEEDEKPAPKKRGRPAKKQEPEDDEDDEDDDTEDDDDEPEEPSDLDEDDENDDDSELEDEPAPKKKRGRPVKK